MSKVHQFTLYEEQLKHFNITDIDPIHFGSLFHTLCVNVMKEIMQCQNEKNGPNIELEEEEKLPKKE